MTPDQHAHGGAAVAVLNQMQAWEANLVLNLRLWCEGPSGQQQVWNEYRAALKSTDAHLECHAFETLVRTIVSAAHRPMIRHHVGCSCVGADEAVFVNLIRFASEGHLNDAALVATLLIGPARAEHVAVLAGQVGECARRIHGNTAEFPPEAATNVVRLH